MIASLHKTQMKDRIPFYLLAILAIVIGLYPIMYAFVDPSQGFLASKPASLLKNIGWNIGFYTHIVFGGIALLSGWSQFSNRLRLVRPGLHRNLGKVYVGAVLLSGLAGLLIGPFATTGYIAAGGFMSLALIWLYTTVQAYLSVRKKDFLVHEKMMIYSYAACFAAVSLRLWLPMLIGITGSFEVAYPIVSWICWVPNLLFAHFVIVKKWRPYLL
jgi:hypothetical protein